MSYHTALRAIPTDLSNVLDGATQARPARLIAFHAPDRFIHLPVMDALARQTAQGHHVGVLVGHNHFALHAITRRAQAHRYDSRTLLARIQLARVFTCYQLHQRVATLAAPTVHNWRALYVLGILDTLSDEVVTASEATYLLKQILAHLKNLSQAGLPVFLTFDTPYVDGREGLITLIADYVAELWAWAGTATSPAQTAQLALPWSAPTH